jgi:hypothetical protein
MKYLYKSNITKLKENIYLDKNDLLNQKTFKYADYDFAYELSTKSVKNLLDNIPKSNYFKYRIVDVKISNLVKGQPQANLFWHTDCTMNPFDGGKPENHYIFISGADCRTEFLKEDIEIEYKTNDLIKEMNDAIKNKNPNTFHILENTLYKYDRFSIHRATRANKKGLRVLVRVTETDIISPRSKGVQKYGSRER